MAEGIPADTGAFSKAHVPAISYDGRWPGPSYFEAPRI